MEFRLKFTKCLALSECSLRFTGELLRENEQKKQLCFCSYRISVRAIRKNTYKHTRKILVSKRDEKKRTHEARPKIIFSHKKDASHFAMNTIHGL